MTVSPPNAPPTLTAPTPRPAGAWWAWRPLHGGAGTSTLGRAVPCGIVLADDPSELGWPTLPVSLSLALTREVSSPPSGSPLRSP